MFSHVGMLVQCTTAQNDPSGFHFQDMKATFKKGSHSSRPKRIRGTIHVGTEKKKTAWGSLTHTHQHAPLPTVHSCSAEIFSSRFKMG